MCYQNCSAGVRIFGETSPLYYLNLPCFDLWCIIYQGCLCLLMEPIQVQMAYVPILLCADFYCTCCMYSACMSYFLSSGWELLQVALSVDRSVSRMVGRSKKIWTTSMGPRELIFGMQLAANLTKRNIKKNIGNILRFSSKSQL